MGIFMPLFNVTYCMSSFLSELVPVTSAHLAAQHHAARVATKPMTPARQCFPNRVFTCLLAYRLLRGILLFTELRIAAKFSMLALAAANTSLSVGPDYSKIFNAEAAGAKRIDNCFVYALVCDEVHAAESG
jgi:hypothetical protein